MHYLEAHKWLSTSIALLILLAAVVLWQVLFIKFHHGAAVPAPDIPRGTEAFGMSGTPIRFVVMGDSTSIGQGADYDAGIARRSAAYLAQTHHVELTNVGVSGARVADVLHGQVAKAVALHPDVVLLAIGANDVTHFTSFGSVRQNITVAITQLQSANPRISIILTGSPAMGPVPRFALPTQWIMAWRTRHINDVFASVAKQKSVI